MERNGVEAALHLVRALADEDRLKLVGLLAMGERSAAELAGASGLDGRAVAHHLARLGDAGLLAARDEGGARRYRFDGAALRTLGRAALAGERPAPPPDEDTGEAWERRVLTNFFDGERLKEIPAARQKRLVVLRWLAARFEPGVAYPEKEVNEIIKCHHPDFATLRRLMVDEGLMVRERGTYRRSEK
ncbi:MAG TPA: DUF2087 domain-containing protein [Thermomicrobiales bacterium]|nr:DUF2087 domain-containing protein [Thermomicrobiales bacterium]